MMVFTNAISHYEAFSLVVTNALRESIRCGLSFFWNVVDLKHEVFLRSGLTFTFWPHIPLYLAWLLTLLGFLMLSKCYLI